MAPADGVRPAPWTGSGGVRGGLAGTASAFLGMPLPQPRQYKEATMRDRGSPRRRPPCWLLVGLAAWLLGGCAHLHVDDQGRRHLVGFVWLTLPAADVGPVGADALRARSVGLAIVRSPAGSGVTLGYSDQTVTVIRNDALVRLPADAAKEETR